MRRVFETEVALAVIFEEPTVAGLAGAIVEAREGRKEGKKEKEGGRRAGRIVRVSREGGLPLSYAQQRLWFIDQLEPGSAAYNISMMLRVRGELQVEALERAVAGLVARHEALRTHFEWVEGQAVQVIAGSWGGGVEVVDVRGRSEDEERRRERRRRGSGGGSRCSAATIWGEVRCCDWEWRMWKRKSGCWCWACTTS